MGLKSSIVIVCVLLTSLELKSDHCGIEISNGLVYVGVVLVLKSDHCGIEIVIARVRVPNWNALKSDHCGIEITFCHSRNIDIPD